MIVIIQTALTGSVSNGSLFCITVFRVCSVYLSNAVLLSAGLSGIYFSEILIEIQTLSFNKIHFKMSSARYRSFWPNSLAIIFADPHHHLALFCENRLGSWKTVNSVMHTWVTRYGWDLGAVSIRKTVLPGMAIPMLKIRRPNGRLIFNVENAIRR